MNSSNINIKNCMDIILYKKQLKRRKSHSKVGSCHEEEGDRRSSSLCQTTWMQQASVISVVECFQVIVVR